MLMNIIRRNPVVRGVLVVQLLLGLLFVTGCGGVVFVGFVSNPQPHSTTVTGRVDNVFLSSVNDLQGNVLTITSVRLINNGLVSNLDFCGDQRVRLPVNDVVRVDFTQETSCLLLVNVVILS